MTYYVKRVTTNGSEYLVCESLSELSTLLDRGYEQVTETEYKRNSRNRAR